jgi:hypothetical protein
VILLATKVLSVRALTALAAGFDLGAMIRTADKVRKEEILNAPPSTLYRKQMAR